MRKQKEKQRRIYEMVNTHPHYDSEEEEKVKLTECAISWALSYHLWKQKTESNKVAN